MKKYILIAALSASTGIFAQQPDSLLRRQMELERDFNPTLLDANKINSLPTLRQPAVRKASAGYSTWAGRTTPPLEIAVPRPGTIMTRIPYNAKKGYLSFLGGNYANIDGAFGYRLLENKKNSLSFGFLHTSTNGNIDYVQKTDPASNQASFADNSGRLDYEHLFGTFKMNMHISYLHSLFNYYGNTFGGTRVFENKRQQWRVLNANIGAESQKSDWLNYRGYIDFRNFSTKFGETVATQGIKGNQIDAGMGVDKPFEFQSDGRIGIDGRFLGTFYGNGIDPYSLAGASPYVDFEGFNWKAKLGVDVLFQLSGKTKVRVAPNANLSWQVAEHSSLYADLKGGFSPNTLPEMMNESRYTAVAGNVKPSFSIVDLKLGAKIGEMSGFRFDVFGGFKQTNEEHFLILNHIHHGGLANPYPFYVVENLLPVYGNLSHSHIGGRIESNVWAPLDIAFRVEKNFHTVKDLTIHSGLIGDAKAYGKPGFEADVRATLEATDRLQFSLNYYFAGDRWSYFDGENVKMTSINDLNLGAVYEINNAFSIYLRANNVLFCKYDVWYGHPAQGFNATGGFTFKF